MIAGTAPDFSGKVVLVYVNTGFAAASEPSAWTLESPALVEQAGRAFLVGTSLDHRLGGPFWHTGTLVHIRWNLVTHYVVFASVEAYRQAARLNTPVLEEAQVNAPAEPKAGWFGRRTSS